MVAIPCKDKLALLEAFGAKANEMNESLRRYNYLLSITADDVECRAALRMYEQARNESHKLHTDYMDHREHHGC